MKNVTAICTLLVSSLASGGAAAQDVMEEGRKLFSQAATPACAVCHTLQEAGAQGAIGPNLDELRPDASRVAKAVRNGIGQMPAFTHLSDSQVEILSRYVEKAAGTGK